MKRVCAIALMLCLLCGVMPTVQAAPEAVTLAAFSFGNDGAVAEEGSYDSLMEKGGVFAGLYRE